MTTDVPYRFHTPIQVRWGDCDAAGHVNNATYLTYLEEARIAYWRSVAGDLSFGDLIIARVEIDYRAQAYTGDVLEVYLAVTELRNSSFWVDYRIVRADGVVVATARSAQLFFDYATQKPRPMSDEFRRIVAEYEPGLVPGGGVSARTPPAQDPGLTPSTGWQPNRGQGKLPRSSRPEARSL